MPVRPSTAPIDTLITGLIKALMLSLVFLMCQPSHTSGETSQQLDSTELTVLNAAEVAVQIGRQFTDSVWPGYNLNHAPFIAYIPEKWVLLANVPHVVEGFTDCPSTWPPLSTHALYHQGQLGQLSGQLAFNLQVDSFRVTAVGFLGYDYRRFLELIIHENFHQFQFLNFGNIPWAREELYPVEDAVNTSLANLEMLVLRDALRLFAEAEEDSARAMVAQFVAVRNLRWKQADPWVSRYEQGQEINEGTAQYVQIKGMSMVPRLDMPADWSGPVRTLIEAPEPLAADKAVIRALERLIEGGCLIPRDVPRNRIYAVGAAQGLLLDLLGVDWKPTAQQAGTEFAFAGLMADAVNIDSSKLNALAASARAHYKYDALLKLTRKQIVEYRQGFSQDSTAFASQTGYRITINMSGRNLRRSGTSFSNKWLVDNGSMKLVNLYNLYVLQSTAGEDLHFQLKDAALLELNDWQVRDKTLVFYCDNITTCETDGITQEIGSQVSSPFGGLHIAGDNFSLDAVRQGAISISDDAITIDLK